MKFKLTAFSAMALSAACLIGCNKTPSTSFSELNKVLSPSETTLEQRTIEWYANQSLIRDQVLKVCLTHLTDKAEQLGGAYKVEFDNDVFSKFTEYPDCANARKGEIMNLTADAKIYEHQIKNAERLLNTPESRQEVDELAAEVAKRITQHAEETNEANETGMEKLKEFEAAISP